MTRIFGYIRVSTKKQNYARQKQAMYKFGIPQKYIFIDKSTGSNFKRPQFMTLKEHLKKGDTLIIESIDRLGRNYKDIIQQWNDITKNIKADIKVLDMPLLDTTIKNENLINTFIRDIILLILSFTAEQELHAIKHRQSEGIAIAKLKGKCLGRPKKKINHKRLHSIYSDYLFGKISTKDALEKLNISKSTFYKLIKECNFKEVNYGK